MMNLDNMEDGFNSFKKPGMEVGITVHDGKLNISLSGHLSFWDAGDFKKVIAAMDDPELTACEFDLQNLESIDSSGLGMFVNASDMSTHHGYAVSLVGTYGSVQNLLEISRMDRLFQIP